MNRAELGGRTGDDRVSDGGVHDDPQSTQFGGTPNHPYTRCPWSWCFCCALAFQAETERNGDRVRTPTDSAILLDDANIIDVSKRLG